MADRRPIRAGDSIEDVCRACKQDRMHVVVAATPDGWPLRVQCGFCRSEHHYRGGPKTDVTSGQASSAAGEPAARPRPLAAPFPLVSDRERAAPPVMLTNDDDLELLIRRVIREEAGLTAVTPAEKWRGGQLVLKPGTPGLQEKSWPIETFFHKVVMLRNRLRTLEQQVNASALQDDVKVKIQGYVSGCYGSLTSFNVLFADEADQFKGSGGDER
jgi:hypothetical protein